MTALYELTTEYQNLRGIIADQDLTSEDFVTALTQFEGEIRTKVENIGLLIKETEAAVEGIDVEIKRLSERKRTRQNKIEWLKEYLKENLPEDRMEFPLVTVMFQKNPPSVEVIGDVAAEFIRIIPEQQEPNKKALLDHWKTTGSTPAGTVIHDATKRLVVK